MNKLSDSIPKQPVLKPAEDFYQLRREGIGYIEQMGSALWTDYNTHDPGITILESLCYAITDLAYRTNWPIADLLMPGTPASAPAQPYPKQAFFSARDILTINPLTPDDFRRLLIDLEPVRNAWVFCRQCSCNASYFAWCELDQLQLAYLPPEDKTTQTLSPQGLYDVLLELEADPLLGDLNDNKVSQAYDVFDSDGAAHTHLLEMRFPNWGPAHPAQWLLFLHNDDAFSASNGASFTIKVAFGATPDYDVLSDPLLDAAGRNNYLNQHWRQLWYVRFEIQFLPGLENIVIDQATLRLFGDSVVKSQAMTDQLQTLFEDTSANGFIQRYRDKWLVANAAVKQAKSCLQAHRNLDEDFCRIQLVSIEDITVCGDVEITAAADIERVQAEIWLAIEQYLNPNVPFYSLQELLDAGMVVEDIFNGPPLVNGFIQQQDLDASALKTVLRCSDLVNSLMDIEGVVAVNNLLLSKYDDMGIQVKGAADPDWTNDGKPLFDTNKISASWLLYITPLHQPRFHRELSRFLFFKNGLPFLPRKDEALDTLVQLRGERDRLKISQNANDLPIPQGRFRHPEAYFPLQYGFPLAYGIGPEGLPSGASLQRQAQAKQLKAYLLVFEQLLANAQAQIAHSGDLFSLDPAVIHSYFVQAFDDMRIKGYAELQNGLNEAVIQQMAESDTEFYSRRNRFLNHLMARFGEQFTDYALLLSNAEGVKKANQRLIEDKIAFLHAYPAISHSRAKAFDYSLHPSANNRPGLQKRISLLLGFADLSFIANSTGADGGPYIVSYRLQDALEQVRFSGDLSITAATTEAAERQAYRILLQHMSLAAAFATLPEAGAFRLTVKDTSGATLGQSGLFTTENEALDFKTELLSWSANQRAILVEHLLLRPKFPGDALYPACSEGGCNPCDAADPYSFRLTWVMPGWTPPYNNNLELRAFAERSIRQEMPAHLLGKVCWTNNDAGSEITFDDFETAWDNWLGANADIDWTADKLQDQLEAILKSRMIGNAGTDLCSCSGQILQHYGEIFHQWLQQNIQAGNELDNLTAFEPYSLSLNEPGSVNPPNSCIDLSFSAGSNAAIQSWLDERYAGFRNVSYYLRRLLALLANLSNTYPEATLHDCDDGSDANPVRLGQTALGALPLDDSSPATS